MKAQPLRNPGQSLDEEIEHVVYDEFLAYVLLTTTFWVLAIFEWAASKWNLPRLPGTLTLASVAATILCAWKFTRTQERVRRLTQGRDGEREVAEILDGLRASGAQTLHDIQGEEGNVDHVLICRRGVYVIETKTRVKPPGAWKLDYDGEQIHPPESDPTAAPIVQCKAEVSDIRALLRESTSKAYPVRGVVVFLDWFVHRRPAARGAEVWVLNPKELGGWIHQEPEVLSDVDVAMATLHLKQYIKKLAA